MSEDEDLISQKTYIASILRERDKYKEEIQVLKKQLIQAGIIPFSSAKSVQDVSSKRYSLPASTNFSVSEEFLDLKRQSSSQDNLDKKQILCTYDKRSGTTDFGKQYEYVMCAFYAVRFATSSYVSDFEMTTNHEIYGDFDDIALKVQYVNGSSHTYLLQLKHTENKKRLTENNLCTENKDFSMMKYLKTFQKLEEHENVSCILFTNRTAFFKDSSNFFLNDVELAVKKHKDVICEELLDTNQSSKKSVFQFSTVEKTCDTSEISKFLDQFYLLANQGGVSKMTSVITELLKDLLQRDVYNIFIHFMKNWWCGNFVLSKNDVIEKLADLALSPFIRNISEEKYNNKSQILKDVILKFDITLVHSNNVDIISEIWYDSVDARELSLTALKYGLTNKGVSSIEDLSDEQKSKVLWYLNKAPLVIKVHDSVKDQIKCVVELLKGMAIKKKLVLLGDFTKADFPEWKVFEDLNDIDDDDLYETIIKNFQVSLQGRNPIVLENLIRSREDAKMFGVRDLLVMSQEPLIIGEKNIELPESYISRSVSTNFLDTEKVLQTCITANELLIIISNPDFRNSLKNKNVLFSDLTNEEVDTETSVIFAKKCTKLQFDSICNKTSRRVHLIKTVDDQSCILILSSDNNLKSEDLRHFRAPIKERNIHEIFDNPVNVLCAQPGIGKSTMIKFLDNTCPPDYWSVRVNLRKFNYLLKEEPEEEEILLHFFELSGMRHKTLLDKVKSLFLQNRKIYLFLDGLDEIESNCVDFALDYVNYISSTGVHVWISSRQNLQHVITNRLNIFPIDIQELNQEEQKSYVEKRLQSKYDSAEIEQITKEIFCSADVANSHNMLGIPLQLFIITENFLDDDDLYHKLSEEIFVLTKMYTIFFDGKKKHLYEKVGVQYEQQLGFNFNQHLENYEIPALRCCLDDNLFRNLNIEESSKNREFLETIRNEGDKFGIITQINDEDRVIFAHQTYAEYFACLWLKKNFDKVRIIKEEFKSEKYQNLKLIFDIMLAENCPLHLAVIYRNSEQVRKHLSNIASKDEGGRTALHLICSYGSKYVPLQLEQSLYSNHLYHKENNFNGESSKYLEIFTDLSQCDPFKVDEVFKWSSLDYCFHCQNLYPIEKFLEQYDDKIKLDQLFDNLNSVSIAYYASKLGYPNLLKALLQRNRNVINLKIGENKLSFLHVAVIGVNGDVMSAKKNDLMIRVIKILIDSGIDINIRDKNGATPLHWAVCQGNQEVVKVLLDNGAEVNAIDNREMTIIHYALQEWEEQTKCFKVDNGYFDMSLRDKDGNSVLHWACKENDCDMVKKILEKEVDSNTKNVMGETALHHVVRSWKPDPEIVTLLIQNGIDVNHSDCFGISPLHWAFDKGYYNIIGTLHQKGAKVTTITAEHKLTIRTSYKPLQPNMELMEMLMDYGFNVNSRNSDGVSVLHWVSEKGHIGVVKLLLANGANVNAVTKKKETVLHYVARGWNTKLVKLFTQIGIDINSPDAYGVTSLHRAAEYGHVDMVKTLVDNGAKISSVTEHMESVLNFAVKTREPNVKVIQFFLQKGVDVNSKDEDGISALHWACDRGHYEIVKLLLDRGANVNSITLKGETPLHCTSPNLEMIKLLLVKGINVNSKDVAGMTALHWASERGQVDLVKILVESGGDVNSTTREEETVLIYTLKQRRVSKEVIKYLINKNTDVGAIDKNGMNALHWACENCHYEAVKLLIEKKVDVNFCANNGETTLHHAARSWKPNTDVIKRLLQSGVIINAQDGDGVTALHLACKEGHCTSVEILINSGADVFKKTKCEETTLHFAAKAWKKNDCVLALLIDKGVDVNISDKYEKTALHYAAEKGFYDNVKLLIEKGATTDAVTTNNLTALHFAVYGGHVRIIKLLIEKGLDINKIDAKNTNLPLYFAMRNGHLKQDLLVMMAATIREKFPLLSWTRYSYQEVITYLQEAQPYLEHSSVMKNTSTTLTEPSTTIFGSLPHVIVNNVSSYAEWIRNICSSLFCKKVEEPRNPTFIVHYPVFSSDDITYLEQDITTPTIDRAYTF